LIVIIYIFYDENMHLSRTGKSYYKYINNYLHNTGFAYVVVKQIGSKSKTAALYICKGKIGIGRIFKFALKQYKDRPHRLDVILSIKLSALSLKEINPHFNVVYNLHNNCLLSALAVGDLSTFMSVYVRCDVMKNCLQQVILSIFSFHRHTEMMHNDCHHGNFIYHRIPKGGFFWYQINGKDIYIENMGYQWMINDFDMATEGSNYRQDYLTGIEAFQKWKNSKKLAKIVDEIVTFMQNSSQDNIFYDIMKSSSLYQGQNKPNKIVNKFPYIL